MTMTIIKKSKIEVTSIAISDCVTALFDVFFDFIKFNIFIFKR